MPPWKATFSSSDGGQAELSRLSLTSKGSNGRHAVYIAMILSSCKRHSSGATARHMHIHGNEVLVTNNATAPRDICLNCETVEYSSYRVCECEKGQLMARSREDSPDDQGPTITNNMIVNNHVVQMHVDCVAYPCTLVRKSEFEATCDEEITHSWA